MKAQVKYKDHAAQVNYERMVQRSFNAYRMRGGKMEWDVYASNHGNRLIAKTL